MTTRGSSRSLRGLLLALVLTGGAHVGCADPVGAPDAGRSPDGARPADGGARIDGAAIDAGSPRDSGPARDSGPPLSDPPAWLAGHALEEWFEIPGTAGAGGSAVHAFCGFALRDSTSEIIIAAAGGHSDSADNRVVSLRLDADEPSWVLRKASSTAVMIDVSHYADGLPTSRHTHQSTHVIESLDRVFLFGVRGAFGNAHSFPSVDAFDLTTNEWDPAGTWAPMPVGAGYGAVRLRPSEDVLTTGLFRWSASDQTFSQPVTTRSSAMVRFPIAHDTLRNELLTLQWADGMGFGAPVLSASRVVLSTGVQTNVTIRPSEALTQFEAEGPAYAAMEYDAPNDRFLFFSGQDGAAGRVYVVSADDSDERDISILPLGPGSVTPPAIHESGVHNRFRYVPALRGFVLLANTASNLYFLRTS